MMIVRNQRIPTAVHLRMSSVSTITLRSRLMVQMKLKRKRTSSRSSTVPVRLRNFSLVLIVMGRRSREVLLSVDHTIFATTNASGAIASSSTED